MQYHGPDSFHSPTAGELTIDTVAQAVVAYMAEAPAAMYQVIIGSDSQAYRNAGNRGETDFVSVVVVHRVGHGARYFWRKSREARFMPLREKIYQEATLSLMLAMEVAGKLKEQLHAAALAGIAEPAYALEVHVDIGTNGPTREMIKEVVGMIRGNGFTVRTKPTAYAASIVADKHT